MSAPGSMGSLGSGHDLRPAQRDPDRAACGRIPPSPPCCWAADRRSLAPDSARGMLLLFIALANVWGYLWSTGDTGPGGRPAGGSGVDHLVDGLTAFFVDDRSRPMFAILYGFGLATMASRLASRGEDRKGVRRALARRSARGSSWCSASRTRRCCLGGDILAVAYGVTGRLSPAFLHRSRVTLWVWFARRHAAVDRGGRRRAGVLPGRLRW